MEKIPTNFNKKLCLNNFKPNKNIYEFYRKNLNLKTKHLKNVKIKNFEPSILTLETYPIKNILALKAYLEDLPFDNLEYFEKNKTQINRQYKILTNILNVNKKEYYFIENNNFYRVMHYGYSLENKIGRLYSFLPSMVHLKREIRYFLFKDHYRDVDIINSHPSILLNLMQLKRPNVSVPALEELVKNRNSFYEKISLELNIDIEQVKKRVIICINSESNNSQKSKTLSQLFQDIFIVRTFIWNYEMGNLQQVIRREEFNEKTISKRKISLQAYYCQTQESVWVLKLYNFLKIKIEAFLIQNKTDQHRNFVDPIYLNIDVMIAETFQFIPFFDGAYIKLKNNWLNSQLGNFIQEFNSNSLIIKFKEKELNVNYEMLNEYSLAKYAEVNNFLKSLSANSYLKLLDKLKMSQSKILTKELKESLIKNQKESNVLLTQLRQEKKQIQKAILTERKAKTKDNERLNFLKEKVFNLNKSINSSRNYRLQTEEEQLLINNRSLFMYQLRSLLLKKVGTLDSLKQILDENEPK